MITRVAMGKRLPAEVVVASANLGKLKEIEAILGAVGVCVLRQPKLGSTVAETGRSYLENALIKARHCAAEARRPAIADDSGLEVDALGGAPGVWSARYAGPRASARDNVAKLMRAMAHVPPGARSARFRCVMVYLRHASDPEPLVAEGVWEGEVLWAPRGSQGFGYDPVFYVPSWRCSVAELPADIKNRLSHRAHALRRLYAHFSRPQADGQGLERCG